MCGIAGFADFHAPSAPDTSCLEAMVATLTHRGPDAGSAEILAGVGLGMRRLSIIDVAGGRQPVYNEDRSVRVIFNGEIYNFRELRRELRAAGHTFATQSDTEVLVHAYEEYGIHFPERLNGMFAIALHDLVRRKLLLVRDPLGIKPLYYSFDRRRLIWGSEMKALLASGMVERTLDTGGLNEFLTWEYVPGEGTLFRSIRKLLPGHLLEIDLQQPACLPRPYWELPRETAADTLSDSEWEERVDEQLRRSVQQQLVSDVPLGAFLSGGVDSSLMVAAMGGVQTFSIGFEDTSYNELPWARRVADYLGVPHAQEILRPDIGGLFYQLLEHMDDPIGDFSIFPTYLISQLARAQVKVVLSGDGGDELFGGYEAYQAQQLAAIYHKLPATLRKGVMEPLVAALPPQAQKKGLINRSKRFLEGAGLGEHLGHARWRQFLDAPLRRKLFSPEAKIDLNGAAGNHITRLFREAAGLSPVNRCLYVDLKSYLCDNILTKVDRMSMAASLEARVPYLDVELVELAFRIPDHLKVNRRSTKILLKRVAERHVPRECIYRPKQGFSIPIKQWLGGRLRPLMEDLLNPATLSAQGLFQSGTVARLQHEHLNSKANHSHILWSLMMFQAWRKRWLD